MQRLGFGDSQGDNDPSQQYSSPGDRSTADLGMSGGIPRLPELPLKQWYEMLDGNRGDESYLDDPMLPEILGVGFPNVGVMILREFRRTAMLLGFQTGHMLVEFPIQDHMKFNESRGFKRKFGGAAYPNYLADIGDRIQTEHKRLLEMKGEYDATKEFFANAQFRLVDPKNAQFTRFARDVALARAVGKLLQELFDMGLRQASQATDRSLIDHRVYLPDPHPDVMVQSFPRAVIEGHKVHHIYRGMMAVAPTGGARHLDTLVFTLGHGADIVVLDHHGKPIKGIRLFDHAQQHGYGLPS